MFVQESMKMSRFNHSHVMGLIGVCLDTGSAPYIIMPYMTNGSLLKYLKKERKNIIVYEDTDEDEVLQPGKSGWSKQAIVAIVSDNYSLCR